MQAPQSFGRTHYVPILKFMRGERTALEQLSPTLRPRVTPLFEVCPPRKSRQKGTRTLVKQSMDAALKDVGEKLAKSVVNGRAFIDTIHIPDERMLSAEQPLSYILAAARAAGVTLVPVTGPERLSQHQAVVRRAVAEDQHGVCIRLRKTELFNDDFDEMISTVLDAVGAEPRATDLVLDAGQITSDEVSLLTKAVVGVLGNGALADFRTLTFAAGAFPESISDVEGTTRLARADWALWQALTKRATSQFRLPTFSDYSIQGGLPPTSDVQFARPSANIRYTADDHWLVMRGKSLMREGGYEQYGEMAQYLTKQSCFAGPGFSSGDKYIYDCAHGVEKNGSPEVWRRVGTSHHIAQVLKQLTSPHAT